jgi:hypothetical protein
MSRSKLMGAMTALVLVAAVSSVMAEVFVTSPTTGRILVLDSNGSVTRVIGDTGGVQQPYGIAMDSARNLLVADYAAGRVLQFNPDGTNGSIRASNIPKADGLSVGSGGEIFLVSRDDRTSLPRLKSSSGDVGGAGYLRQVWMVPVGSNLPVMIGSVAESFRLAQTQQVNAGAYSGNLLVLSTRPGLIARFIQTGATSFVRSTDLVSYVPGEPTSMAYSRVGELLISTSDGRVLRYSDTGVRLQPDFAIGLPVGPTRLSINGDGVVHITPVGSTSVIRFDAYGMRLPNLSGAAVPLAAAITSGCVPTPVGQNVTVTPAAGVNVVFDNVVTAGQTCLQTTSLGAGVNLSPRNNTIPGFARRLWEDPGFVVYDVTTTATWSDTVAQEFFSENPDARLMVAHGTGGVFADNTVLVVPDDPRGRTGSLSEFVIYLDTRPNRDVVLLKLGDLQNALSTFTEFIGPSQLEQLQTLVGQITTAVGNGGADSDKPAAVQLLGDLKGFVRENSGEGIRNTPGIEGDLNAAGWLISLSDTLIFQLGL